MKITKYVHACVLVESDNRAALFDPGEMSEKACDVTKLPHLDEVFITHEHGDHFSLSFVKKILSRFPDAKIISTGPVVAHLQEQHIQATENPPDSATLFHSPHAGNPPFLNPPEEIGVHYIESFSHPGDSHTFDETKAVLALPITAPWGSTLGAVNLALKLKPKYIIPIHDWSWHDEARDWMYGRLEQFFKEYDIIFFKPETGLPIEITI